MPVPPSLAFRESEGDVPECAVELESEDEAEPVATYFDGLLRKSCALYPNGSITPAAYHLKGESGFVVGVFDSGLRHNTEVPNNLLVDGVVVDPTPVVAPKVKVKKPKAKPKVAFKRPAAKSEEKSDKRPKTGAAAKSGEGDEDMENDNDDNDDHDKEPEVATKPLEFVLVRCHGEDKYGVHLKTAARDRTQLIEFWGGGKQDEYITKLPELLNPALKHLNDIKATVKQIPKEHMDDFRKIAKKLKADFYSD